MNDDPHVLDKAQMWRAFQNAAPGYDKSAQLQREIGDRLLARLDIVKLSPARILDLGCGTGYCTRALRKRYRMAETVGIDVAHAMLGEARRADGFFTRRRWLRADAERLPVGAASVDLVFSNLALQWCDPDRVFKEAARVLRPGGLFMFTSFGPDTLRELRSAWREVDDSPHVHRFIDMHDLGDALVRARLADPVMDVDRLTLTYNDVLSVLHDLKNIGAHNVAHGRSLSITGKGKFARFRMAYEAMAENGRIPASFEVVYGHAWSPLTDPGYATVPLAGLRRPAK